LKKPKPAKPKTKKTKPKPKPKQVNRRRGRRPKKSAWSAFTPGRPVKSAVDPLARTAETWVNDQYQVLVYDQKLVKYFPPHINLSIRREGREPIHDWRDMYRIKSELCGTGCWAVEVYPEQSALVDTANQYHLFVFAPGFIFPIKLQQPGVTDYSGQWGEFLSLGQKALGPAYGQMLNSAKQREWADHHKCDDLPLVGPVWAKRGFGTAQDGKIVLPPGLIEHLDKFNAPDPVEVPEQATPEPEQESDEQD